MKLDGQLGSTHSYPAIPKWLDRWTQRIHNHPAFWVKLGQWENGLLEPWLHSVTVNQPIYITGYARSGSTLLLHLLDQCPPTASFRYQHFPFVHTPWFWSWFVRNEPQNLTQGRAHQDRLKVNAQSPEGLDAMLWRHYAYRAGLGATRVQAPATLPDHFFTYYDRTLCKLLRLQDAKRYLSKNNTLAPHLHQLWQHHPQAKVISVVRHPYDQIASLVKQHQLFCAMQRQDPAVLRYMQGMCHFEFGLDRRPLALEAPFTSHDIAHKWRSNNDIEGYAMQWANVYSHLHELKQHSKWHENLYLIPYERLCADPETTLNDLGLWLNLDTSASQHYARSLGIAKPAYYYAHWNAGEKQRVSALVGDVAKHLGYEL